MTRNLRHPLPHAGKAARTCRAGLRDILCRPLQNRKKRFPSSREHACTGTDYPSLHPMICYNPPHMDDVQTSKEKNALKKRNGGDFIP